MPKLADYLAQSADLHSHLCPRQVLGVRAGLAAANLFDIELPQRDKRLFAFVETDGCFVDGVGVTTGCALGHRTLRLVDFGKVAVTFVDTMTGLAYRLTPRSGIRELASTFAPEAETPWHAQVLAYQTIPIHELLRIEQVDLAICLQEIMSLPGLRVNCARCGEEVMNARQILYEGEELCLWCATPNKYYQPLPIPGAPNKPDLLSEATLEAPNRVASP